METIIQKAKVGQKTKNFIAEAYLPDGTFGHVSTKELLDSGKWLVLFFWPRDFTTVCPTEVIAMSNQIHKFEREDAIVLGISTDSKETHRAWSNLDPENGGCGKVRFPMLEDQTHKISQYYDVLVEEVGHSLRGTFIISPDGILQSSSVYNTNVGRNIDEILRTLAAFQTGGLCGVNWHEGDENL